MQFFPFILGFLFLALGIVLIVLGARQNKRKSLKVFLLLAGISAVAWLPLVVLHNMFYAFAITVAPISLSLMQDMTGLEIVTFLMATIGCPIGFIAGVMGSIIAYIRSRKK
ncbi:hypothetical protein KKC88_00435 [Patescibacteria group bacterium]|nr:hypothetical protein [Patescibacteria group bacterium]MBU1674036.1 hypothetical protein [Patescibacteria group bacterium]MBU1963184.1 hypothetical protein [Patescibacteria group bacterium]